MTRLSRCGLGWRLRLGATAILLLVLGRAPDASVYDPLLREFKEEFLAKEHEMPDEERTASVATWEERLKAGLAERAAAGNKEAEGKLAVELVLLYCISERFDEAKGFLGGLMDGDLPAEAKASAAVAAVSRARQLGAAREDFVALLELRQRALTEVVEGLRSGTVTMGKFRQTAMERDSVSAHRELAGFDFEHGDYFQAIEELKRHYAALGEITLSEVMKKGLREAHADQYFTLLNIAGCYLSIADSLFTEECQGGSRIGELPESEEARNAYASADEWLARAIVEYPKRTWELSFMVKRSMVNQCRYVSPVAERLNIARLLGTSAEDYLVRARSALDEERAKYDGEELQQALSRMMEEISIAQVFYINHKSLPAEIGYALLDIEMDLSCELNNGNCAESAFFQDTVLNGLSFAIGEGDQPKAEEYLDTAVNLPFGEGTVIRQNFEKLQEQYLDKFANPVRSTPLLADLHDAAASFDSKLSGLETKGPEPDSAGAFLWRHRTSVCFFVIGMVFLAGASLVYLRRR